MKRIQSFLSILILLTLGACTLRVPGVEAPTAIIPMTETPLVDFAALTGTAIPTLEPTSTGTAPPPVVAAATATPTTAPPEPATQATQAVEVQPTATRTAPTATRTQVITFNPYTTYGAPKYQNRMEVANLGEWAKAETLILPDDNNIRLEFKDGDLYVTGKRSNFSTWWFSYHTLSDAFIEMTFDTEDCTGEDAYGMIFRGPPHLAGKSYGYVVSFSCNGRVLAFRLDSVDPWKAEPLVDVDATYAINTGRDVFNVMGIRTVGDRFVIYANNVQVAEVQDNTFKEGRVGVFVRAGLPDAYTYRVTNFSYWILESR